MGYIQFENGVTIRGYFKVEQPENLNIQKYAISFYDDKQTYDLIFTEENWKKIIKSIKKAIPNIED